jgi:hypothetical protein
MIALKTLLPASKKRTPFGARAWKRLPTSTYFCHVGQSFETAARPVGSPAFWNRSRR